MSEYRVTFAGLSVAIRYDNAGEFDFLDFLFRDVQGRADGDVEAVFRIFRHERSGQYLLTAGDKILIRGQLGVQFAAVLFDAVIFSLLNKNSQGVAFHAGAVFYRDKMILLPGQSGSGKSTVTAWLAAHGFLYLTDELIMMPDTCLDNKAIPFTRPVCIKRGSAAEIKKLLPPDTRQAVLEDESGLLVAHQSLNSDFSRRSGAPSLILFPQYQFGSSLDIQKITGARACTMLMECDVNARNMVDHGFKQVVRLARSVPAYQVTYGSFAGFEHAFDELFAELGW